VRSIEFWTLWPPLIAGILVISIATVGPKWCWLGTAPLLLYPLQALKIAAKRIAHGQAKGDALLYGVAVVLGKFPQHKGLRTYRKSLRTGQNSAIIEYKAPASRSKQLAVQSGHDVS
jgi:hypothetical protein